MSLVLVIPLLVLATGGVIAWRTFSSTRATVNALADDLFANVAEQAVAATRAQLLRAVPTVNMARMLAHETDQQSLQTHLVGLLRANPECSWVTWSKEDGSFVGSLRSPEGTLRINRSWIEGGKTIMKEVTVGEGGATTPYRENLDFKYDPRTRPFYKQAAAAHKRIWTAPYVFFDQSVPGITCAEPELDGDKLRGVATVDFDLNALSRFVAKLKLSEHGRVFLMTQDDLVIAHPSVDLVWHKAKAPKVRWSRSPTWQIRWRAR